MKVSIYGTGSIGCYLGGRLAAVGIDVDFIARPQVKQQLKQYGLTVSDYLGRRQTISADELHLCCAADVVNQADIIFVCVKSAATQQVAAELSMILKKRTIIISFQNGLSNVEILKQSLGDHTILEGMVPFNVVALGNGVFHQGTEGTLSVKKNDGLTELTQAFHKAHLGIKLEEDMQGIQWAKLLLNLNNSINALSQLPLKQQLSIHEYRQCLAMAQLEALKLLKIAKIKPAQLTIIPAGLVPYILKLPNTIFNLVSRKMLEIDPHARSSMADDLLSRKKTEVDWINGEIVKLAEQLNLKAPINQKLIELIKQAESTIKPKAWTAVELKAELAK